MRPRVSPSLPTRETFIAANQSSGPRWGPLAPWIRHPCWQVPLACRSKPALAVLTLPLGLHRTSPNAPHPARASIPHASPAIRAPSWGRHSQGEESSPIQPPAMPPRFPAPDPPPRRPAPCLSITPALPRLAAGRHRPSGPAPPPAAAGSPGRRTPADPLTVSRRPPSCGQGGGSEGGRRQLRRPQSRGPRRWRVAKGSPGRAGQQPPGPSSPPPSSCRHPRQLLVPLEAGQQVGCGGAGQGASEAAVQAGGGVLTRNGGDSERA